MPNEKRTHDKAGGNNSGASARRDDRLAIRKQRLRHDEAQPPRGYELEPDGWPVGRPPKGSRKPTDDDKALGHAVIRAVQWALGEADDWEPGPDDTIMNDELRSHLEAAYKALAGHPWGHPDDDPETRRRMDLERRLALLLRLREQAKVYRRIRSHRGRADAPRADGYRVVVPPPTPRESRELGKYYLLEAASRAERSRPPPESPGPGRRLHPGGVVDVSPVAMSGAEIVQGLRTLPPLLHDEEFSALARLIDELPEDAVNLGGAGGPGGGRTPEQWARSLVLALKDPLSFRADCEKRRRRSGRRRDAP